MRALSKMTGTEGERATGSRVEERRVKIEERD